MTPPTHFLSRLLGLFTLLVALAMIVRRGAAIALVMAVVRDPSLLLVFGLLTLAAGLGIVLAHNVWSGGALPVVITLFGWLILIRGLFLLFTPPEVVANVVASFHFERFYVLYLAIPLVLGAILTWAGFRAPRH